MDWSNHWLVQTTLLGTLLGIGFIIPALWLLGLLGVAGVIYYFLYKNPSLFQVWWIFMVKALIVSSWIWAVYPIDWLGFSLGWFELPIIGFYWSTVSASLAMGGVVLLLSVRLSKKYTSLVWIGVLMPLLWLVAELAQSIAFSIFLYGPGGTIGSTYSMGYIGYLLAEHALIIKTASIAGVYGVTIILVALAVVGLGLFIQKRYVILLLGVILLVSTSVWNTGVDEELERLLTIVTIDTFTPQDNTSDTSSSIDEAMTAAKAIKPDYIVLPEDSRHFDQSLDTKSLNAILSFWQSDTEAVIVDSGRIEVEDHFVLQAAVYDAKEKELFQAQKRYLVPQGEFLPYIYSILFSLIGQTETSEVLQNRLAYRVGPDVSQTHFSSRIPAVLFCFEVVDARGIRKVVSEREGSTPFVAHIISHAWIHPSVVFRYQLDTLLRVQAIWNDTYIVSAGNHNPGHTVTPTGRILYGETIAVGEGFEVKVIQIPEPQS